MCCTDGADRPRRAQPARAASTIGGVDTEAAVGLGWLGGLASCGVVLLAIWGSERRRAPLPEPAPTLPPGLAAVLAVLPSSALVLDASDRVVRASAAAYAVGLVRGERLGSPELIELARAVRRDGEIRDTEIETDAGTVGQQARSFTVRVAPLITEGLVVILAEDRTEARRVETARRHFVANVSHELKTPVGALSLLAETTEDAADDPEAVRRFAGRMRHESARLNNLMQELITLSLLEGAGPASEPADVALDAVIGEAVDRCRLATESGGIELDVRGTRGLHVLGDADLLTTALCNLLDNAIAYSPARTRVSVDARQVDGVTEVSVTDEGIGIPAGDLGRIFERFYRADPARSRATGGTGLGLAIVKHVMANHSGEVTVGSQEGAGSTFTLRLPAPAPALATAAARNGGDARSSGARSSGEAR